MNPHHQLLLKKIKARSGTPTQHTFLDNYLGNTHPRYAINAPTLREIGREWKNENRDLGAKEFQQVVSSLIEGKSSTEKVMAGILLDNATADQKKFKPEVFDRWLDHLVGWAEIDSVCTGKYTVTEIPADLPTWKKLLTRFSKSDNINKRRASLVFLCSPLRVNDSPGLAALALSLVERLKSEKEVIITRAISWVLRSMVKHHRPALTAYLKDKDKTLPPIALRETKVKLKTGTKSGKTKGKSK